MQYFGTMKYHLMWCMFTFSVFLTFKRTCSLSFVRSIIFIATFFLLWQWIPNFTTPKRQPSHWYNLRWAEKSTRKRKTLFWYVLTCLPSSECFLQNKRSNCLNIQFGHRWQVVFNTALRFGVFPVYFGSKNPVFLLHSSRLSPKFLFELW